MPPMKKWLEGAVEKVTQRVAKKAGEVATEQAKKQAAARVEDMKSSAKDALRRAEEALFGPDSEAPADAYGKTTGTSKRDMKTEAATPAAHRRASSDGEGGQLKRAREDADRRAAERVEADAAKEQNAKKEIDDELAAMKKRLGRR